MAAVVAPQRGRNRPAVGGKFAGQARLHCVGLEVGHGQAGLPNGHDEVGKLGLLVLGLTPSRAKPSPSLPAYVHQGLI